MQYLIRNWPRRRFGSEKEYKPGEPAMKAESVHYLNFARNGPIEENYREKVTCPPIRGRLLVER